jgi:hypothetical protein
VTREVERADWAGVLVAGLVVVGSPYTVSYTATVVMGRGREVGA